MRPPFEFAVSVSQKRASIRYDVRVRYAGESASLFGLLRAF